MENLFIKIHQSLSWAMKDGKMSSRGKHWKGKMEKRREMLHSERSHQIVLVGILQFVEKAKKVAKESVNVFTKYTELYKNSIRNKEMPTYNKVPHFNISVANSPRIRCKV